jgi:hypothetical protein
MPSLHHEALSLYLSGGSKEGEAHPARRQHVYLLRLMDKPVMISNHRQIR